MPVTKPPTPLVLFYVDGNDEESMQMAKDWIADNKYTSEEVRLMRGKTGIWVEEKKLTFSKRLGLKHLN